jgi:CheY-like chemotaxis protein
MTPPSSAGSAERTESLVALVVDDDPDQRMVLRRVLTTAGIGEVLEAADGEAAIAVASSRAVDLIVLDVAMPGRSGIEVLPELHEVVAGAPIVVLSSLPRLRLADVALRRGAVGYVEKSLPTDRLGHEILLAAAIANQAAGVVSHSFPSDVGSAQAARRFIRGQLAGRDDGVLSAIELLVSELVTNAVLHATSAPRVDVALTSDLARIEVYDDDPTLPTPRDPGPAVVGGRGLLLVDRLSARWGAEARGSGKVIWFEIDRDQPQPAT